MILDIVALRFEQATAAKEVIAEVCSRYAALAKNASQNTELQKLAAECSASK